MQLRKDGKKRNLLAKKLRMQPGASLMGIKIKSNYGANQVFYKAGSAPSGHAHIVNAAVACTPESGSGLLRGLARFELAPNVGPA